MSLENQSASDHETETSKVYNLEISEATAKRFQGFCDFAEVSHEQAMQWLLDKIKFAVGFSAEERESIKKTSIRSDLNQKEAGKLIRWDPMWGDIGSSVSMVPTSFRYPYSQRECYIPLRLIFEEQDKRETRDSQSED